MVGVENEAVDNVDYVTPKSPSGSHSPEDDNLGEQRYFQRKLTGMYRNLRYVERQKHTHLTDKLSDGL